MNSKALKEFIAKRCGVQLSAFRKKGMADFMGAVNLKNRSLEWKEFDLNHIPDELPDVMKSEISNIMSEFESKFSNEQKNVKLVFAYYAADASIKEEHLDAIENHEDPIKAKEFKDLVDWMNNYGARLLMSSYGKQNYLMNKGVNVENQHLISDNKSSKWLEQHGYIWGLKKKNIQRNKRVVKPITKTELQIYKEDPNVQSELNQKDIKYVSLVVEQKSGSYGPFFSDGIGIYPIIGDNYYELTNTNEFSSNLVNKDIFKKTKGQHSKFFSCKSVNGDEVRVAPMETTFVLSNGHEDPQPLAVPKTSLKDISTQRLPLYKLLIKEDCTLWWVPKDDYGAAIGKKYKNKSITKQPNIIPCTRDQVIALVPHIGEQYSISNPDTWVYDWDSLPNDTPEAIEEKKAKLKDWDDKTTKMDQLYDYLVDNSNQPPHVALQAYKYVIIGPRFVAGFNTDQQETMGRMMSHENYSKGESSSSFYGHRKDWVAIGNEFNKARAEARGERGFAVGQSISGLGPKSGFSNIHDAIVTTFKNWGINCPMPNSETLKQADALFQTVHDTHEVEENNQVDTEELTLPNLSINNSTQDYEDESDLEDQNKQEIKDLQPVLAKKSNALTKNASSYIRFIKNKGKL